VVGGGDFNVAGYAATVGGGGFNNASGFASTIGGGQPNTASGAWATVGGGENNSSSGTAATVAGGNNNLATGDYAAIPGGDGNIATGPYSFAAGRQAQANHDGSFVWADDSASGNFFASTSSNQFLIRAAGGVGIGTALPSRELEVQSPGDTEIGIKSTDPGGHLWTLQSSGTNSSANLDASFQIIDRTLVRSRFYIGTNGNVGIGKTSPATALDVTGTVTANAFSGDGSGLTGVGPASGSTNYPLRHSPFHYSHRV
jgi:hypothetical protein